MTHHYFSDIEFDVNIFKRDNEFRTILQRSYSNYKFEIKFTHHILSEMISAPIGSSVNITECN